VTERVSVRTGGGQSSRGAYATGTPALSADGRYVLYTSYAADLVGDDTNGVADVFLRDRRANTTERVSLTAAGAEGTAHSVGGVAISADGRYFAFTSEAPNFAPGDTPNSTDVFLGDRGSEASSERAAPGAGAAPLSVSAPARDAELSLPTVAPVERRIGVSSTGRGLARFR